MSKASLFQASKHKSIVTYSPFSVTILPSISFSPSEYSMAKARQQKQRKGNVVPDEELPSQPVIRRNPTPLEPKTENQRRYINAIKHFKLVFGVGPAGSGKSYVAISIAAEKLESKNIDKIIITRPAVEAGESFGHLPGELEEKFAPYLAPFQAIFEERLGKSYYEYLLKNNVIRAIPLAFMRGLTFENAIVILDEGQNVTPAQMKMFLTRIGENCTVIVDGDIEQVDIPGPSGLTDAIQRLSFIPSVKVIRFSDADIVRSGLVAEILREYRRDNAII